MLASPALSAALAKSRHDPLWKATPRVPMSFEKWTEMGFSEGFGRDF